ncbi:MAG TPA: TetR/AcrR family transcriptional regulator [Nocardioides sp.]|uniref:TetR/AcrR family transcriptional regulator n=1 Tax=uncultured Nocardioides sp. TaxID=198441 RepID=UPI000EC84E24|nr:TetR/AcrR family transcriptional regulator [uncultured Nocardioides sp.]HCB05132.1 TetR family transcriptional regulator [Nocardioides sp.]HRD59823.1 TetR/AcrR family transcriptional regulator [Nocardioides sp.]HRI94434.1 TetR/AcrR family transcriptional regulator [Nocardioides sp.]HRK44414.1 TetR/AcrR family transcriptional regulator [Nocardioides sp.]
MRSDARENRNRILEVAREAFAEGGEPSMNQIAQRAGVGPGTLYRNYPSREALAMAVYQQEIERLVDSVSGLLAELEPVEALRRWTTALVSAMRKKHGLGDALSPGAHQSITEQSYGPVVAAITELPSAGQADGTIRADADPRDFLQFTGALWRAAPGKGDRSQAMLGLLLDGLQSHR